MSFGLINPTMDKLLKSFRLNIEYSRAEGLYLFDDKGAMYLDFIAQYGAVPFGYNPPDIVSAVKDFLDSGIPSMVQPSVPIKAIELARALIDMAPGEMAQATFCQSGAEAVETAIKLARSTTGKLKIISTENSFHGKTMGALSATGRDVYQKPFFVPAPGFETIPFDDLDALERKLRLEGNEIAAFLVEPIQGEGGIIIPSEGYLKKAEGLCKNYGVIFIVDEIQTGLGRTGYLFACQRDHVEPDILLLSKALGGGLVPIGVCLSTKNAWNDEFGRLHSSTFANNNFTCAVGIAVLNKLVENNNYLIDNTVKMGSYLMDGLQTIAEKFPGVIKDIRGRGLMLGIEFSSFDGSESFSLKHLAEQGGFTALVAGFLLHIHKVRCAPFLNNPMTLRLQPSLNVSTSEIDVVLKAIENLAEILYYGHYSKLFSYLIDRKITGVVKDYRKQKKPVISSPLMPDEKPSERFAFLIHYPSTDEVAKNNLSFNELSKTELSKILDWEASAEAEPQVLVHMPAIRSKAGKVAEGWLIGTPYSGKHLLEMPRNKAVEHLVKAVDCAKGLGAKIVGLGAYTSVVSRGGADLQGRGIAITSGNSYTIATAFDALIEGAGLMSVNAAESTGSVIGATGSIGRVCALMLANEVERLFLVGNPQKGHASIRRLERLADEIYERGFRSVLMDDIGSIRLTGIARWLKGYLNHLNKVNPGMENQIRTELDKEKPFSFSAFIKDNLADEGLYSVPPIKATISIKYALRNSDLVISASSATANLIGPEDLKPGSIICDVARPPDVSKTVLDNRKDVLVIEGGLVRYPDDICFGQNIGYEPGINLACLSETILLALEGDYGDYSIGSKISLEEVQYLKRLASTHGFGLAQPRNGLGNITPEIVKAVREMSDSQPKSRFEKEVSMVVTPVN